MKTYMEFLREGIVDKLLVPPLSVKLLQAYDNDRGAAKPRGLDIAGVVDALVAIDPTAQEQNTMRRNAYLKKIAEWYAAGNFSLEDADRTREWLETFHKNKARIQKKDINAYASASDLRAAVEPFLRQAAGERVAASGKEAKRMSKQDVERVHEDERWLVLIPKTEDAAKLYGANTQWCTAAEKHNRFDYYNKQGPLYILIDKKAPDGDDQAKLQFHFESDQFMDVHDDEIDVVDWVFANRKLVGEVFREKIAEWLGEQMVDVPAGEDVVDFFLVARRGNAIYFINNPSEAVQLAAVNQNGFAIRYINNPSEAVQLAAVNQNGNAIYFINNPSEAVQLAAVNQNGFAIKYIKNPSEAVQLAAVNQYWGAIYFINNPSEAVQLAAVNQNGRAIQDIKNPSEAVKKAAGVK